MNCDPKELELAQKVLAWSRRRINSLCPLLLSAVHALQERVLDQPGPMSTDGVHLWYWPGAVLADFRKDRDLPAQRLLHMTLHCLLGHLSLREEQKRAATPDLAGKYALLSPGERGRLALDILDLLLDQKAAYWMSQLCGDDFFDRRLGQFSEQPLGRMYRDVLASPLAIELLLRNGPADVLDDHGLWSPPARLFLAVAVELPGGEEAAPDWNRLLHQMALQASGSSRWGHLAGELESELRPEEAGEISYTQFLRRFAGARERRLSDPDSLDARWYHLGLELYGDIPILEPTELSEPPVPDELVIAIDTSGSCEGEVCRRLLRETAGLLRDVSAGADAFRVLLLQCDTEVQQELLLTSPEQLARLAEDFHPQGFGGTDFRPVFRRVEELRENGTLPHVRGLLYLSDGMGDFPEEAPDYPVAFLIPEDGPFFPDIPDWVTTLRLNENDFTVKEAAV